MGAFSIFKSAVLLKKGATVTKEEMLNKVKDYNGTSINIDGVIIRLTHADYLQPLSRGRYLVLKPISEDLKSLDLTNQAYPNRRKTKTNLLF